MITKPTIFVLGAGASEPYGFPLGFKLREQICDIYKVPKHTERLNSWGHTDNEIASFLDAFRWSHLSIDAFLARRSEFSTIGKTCIALIVGDYELSDSMTNPKLKDHWYSAFWNTLMANAHQEGDFYTNKCKIVSFNYDRSLEYFLHQAAKHTFGVDDKNAHGVWSSIPILHVYGSLGTFSWNTTDKPGRIFGPLEDSVDKDVATEGLKIIDHAREDDAVFDQVHRWFMWAERIVFLGFGFEQLNVKRLALRHVLKNRGQDHSTPTIHYSTFGMTVAEIQRTKVDLSDGTFLPAQEGREGARNLQFLREEGLLLPEELS